MRVLVSGASGMVGRALTKQLSIPSAFNFFKPEVCTLVRHTPRNKNEIYWDPYEMRIDLGAIEDFDAVVHLAGENIGSGDGFITSYTGAWSDRKKHHIMESRRRGTRLISQALASCKKKPKVLVSASGVGYYGSAGDSVLTEASPKGRGFLSDVADVWETESRYASAAGVRTVNLRFGVILSASEGVLAKLYWPFFFGAGGPIGSGRQFMSWITLQDAVRAIEHAIQRSDLRGPVNACAPNPVTNADFMAAFGRAMHRPSLLPMPEVAVRTVFGEMGEETLLVSQRAVPAKLEASGFHFAQPTIDDAMRAALSA